MKRFIRKLSNKFQYVVGDAETTLTTKTSPIDRVAPGYKCDHPGCGIRFAKRQERLKHLLMDHHCEKCGWGHNLSYSFGAVVPDVFLKQHGYCKACTFQNILCVEDEGGVYVEN